MRASIFFHEPNILREAKAGDLFLVHSEHLQECVCTLLTDNDNVRGELSLVDRECVVVACRVGEGEVGHRPTGYSGLIGLDTWITFLQPIEKFAFRERDQDVTPARPAGAFSRCTCCSPTAERSTPTG